MPQAIALALKRGLLWGPRLDIVGHRLSNVYLRRDGSGRAGSRSPTAQRRHELPVRGLVRA